MASQWPGQERLNAALDRLLPRVEKPTRYLGGEVNSIVKDPAGVHTRVALAFPDVYDIGMSHLGFRILYGLLNAVPGVQAERVFMPWTDMLAQLREQRLPLTSLETRRPLDAFDLVGFSMQYELTITNVLAMLDLCRIPLLAEERAEEHPLVLGGGPVIFNPEPFAPFFDLVLAGDAEEAFPELVELNRRMRAEGAPRREIVRAAARLGGWYAPALYDVRPEPLLGMLVPAPKAGEDVPARVTRRVVYDLDRFPFPAEIVVPHAEIVHDRVSWEIMRGCPVGCRFCQAGYIYRPTRERHPDAIVEGVRASVASTGYDEFSLTSLNTGEFGAVEPLITRLMDEMEPRHVSVGLSSLHATTLTESLVKQVRRVRKTGFTMAPEAGSQRMRDVINKNLTEEDILRAARLAFEGGWELIKLYFMIGLPTETMDDVDALVDLAGRIAQMGRKIGGSRVKVTLSASTFIPKVFTPFQWFGMDGAESFAAKQDRIRARVPRGVQFKHHDRSSSWLEGVLSRADRSVAPAIATAFRNGAVFDSWTEHFKLDVWRAAFDAHGIDGDDLATRAIPVEAELPWEVLDPLIRRKWLQHEHAKSLDVATRRICGPDSCSGCAPFAVECVKGIVKATTGRQLTPLPALPESPVPFPREPEPSEAEPEPEPGSLGASDLPVYRYRIRFEKLGRSRFLGHLDLVRALTMAFRRAGVQLAYSKGFKPHPKLSLSPALSLGIGSRAEYVDVDTHAPVDEDLLDRINRTVPEGLRLTAVVPIDVSAPALQDVIERAVYRARVPGADRAALDERVRAFLGSDAWPITRQRKGTTRTIDLRPLVESLEVDDDGALRFALVLRKDGAARPSEVIGALAGAAAAGDAEIEREGQLALASGRPVSPLLAGRARVR